MSKHRRIPEGRLHLYPEPGPKPTFLNDKGQYISSKTDEEARARERLIHEWEGRLISHGFQSMHISKAIEREEARQDNMERCKLDRVQCTRNLLIKKYGTDFSVSGNETNKA